MNYNIIKKSGIILIVLAFIVAAFTPAIGINDNNLNKEQNDQINLEKEVNSLIQIYDQNHNQLVDNLRHISLDIGNPWWDYNWHYRKEITIDHTKIDEDLTNFPLLVNSTDVSLISKCDNGDSVRFLSVDNTIEFNYEIEEWTNPGFNIWVNISEIITCDEDYTFLMYYNNSAAVDNQNPSGVWDSNYMAIWHMDDNTTSSIYDSTIYDIDGIKKGVNEPIKSLNGKISNAQTFDNYDDYIKCGTSSLGMGEYVTWEAWINSNDLSDKNMVIDKFQTGGNHRSFRFYLEAYDIRLLLSGDGVGYELVQASDCVSSNSWYYVVACFNSGTPLFYVNSISKEASGVFNFSSINNDLTATIYIGSQNGIEAEFDGEIDELRISNVVRNVSWIKACYFNQVDPSNFITFTTSPNPPTDPDPEDNATEVEIDANISWTCSDPDGDDLVFDVYFGTTYPPPLVSSGQSNTTYNPGTLNFGTTYYWKIVAENEHGGKTESPIWSFTTLGNNPPNPPIIDGPTSGTPGKHYLFIFELLDPDGDDVYLQIRWGDGNVEDWMGPFDHNATIVKGHTWVSFGYFLITARAKDIYDAVGNWENFPIRMPRNRAINIPFLQFLENHPNLFPILQRLLQRLGL